jgi:hypothetical protein
LYYDGLPNCKNRRSFPTVLQIDGCGKTEKTDGGLSERQTFATVPNRRVEETPWDLGRDKPWKTDAGSRSPIDNGTRSIPSESSLTFRKGNSPSSETNKNKPPTKKGEVLSLH